MPRPFFIDAANVNAKALLDEWRLGGKFEVANLQVFSMLVYQSLMGQLHRQLQQRPNPPAEKRSWFKLW